MFATKFNNLLISEMKKFIAIYNDEVESVDTEVFMEKLKEFLGRPDAPVGKGKRVVKEKVKRVQKIPEDDKRCTSLKKDGERCLGIRFVGGENPEMCSLHNNKKKPLSVIKEAPSENTSGVCEYEFTKGVNKGARCGKLLPCKKHIPTDAISEVPVTKKIPKKTTEFSDDEIKVTPKKVSKIKSKSVISTETDEEADYGDDVYPEIPEQEYDDEEDEEIYD